MSDTKNFELYRVCQVVAPDGIVYRKRFHDGLAPVKCILVKTLEGQWHVLQWSSDERALIQRFRRVMRRHVGTRILDATTAPVKSVGYTKRQVSPKYRDTMTAREMIA